MGAQGWGGWWRDGARDPPWVINALARLSRHRPVGTERGAGANPQGADPQGADPQGADPQGVFHPGQPVPTPAASTGHPNSQSPFNCSRAAHPPSPTALSGAASSTGPAQPARRLCWGAPGMPGAPHALLAAPTLSSIPVAGLRCQPHPSPCPTHPLVPPGGLVVQQGLARCLDGHRLVPTAPVPAFGAMPVPPVPGRQRGEKVVAPVVAAPTCARGPPWACTDPSPVLAGAAGVPGFVGIP